MLCIRYFHVISDLEIAHPSSFRLLLRLLCGYVTERGVIEPDGSRKEGSSVAFSESPYAGESKSVL